MKTEHYQLRASDGHYIHAIMWLPDEESKATAPIAIVQIAHGMGEHALRYERLAEKLTRSGYAVIANDHRGHGKTAIMLGDFGRKGWRRMVIDLREINRDIKTKFPDSPLVLMGHSMGALLTQQYIVTYPGTVDGVILSGSPGFAKTSQLLTALAIATFEKWRLGPLGISEVLRKMIFGQANRRFETEIINPTGFEWLSRDKDEVQKYMDDPFCGFVPCTRSICDMLQGRRHMQKSRNLDRLNPDIPYYVFAGTFDPVNAGLIAIHMMLNEYRARGCLIETRFYEEGRHEMLNEINRDEVMSDLTGWLDRYFAPQD